MGQDLRKLFENEQNLSKQKMPKGHEARFLNKLEEELPIHQQSKQRFSFLNIAASVVILIGLSFGAYQFLNSDNVEIPTETVSRKSLGDISPQFKKVEDYYLASINFELSKIKVTPESKELFDGYLLRLDELNKEYTRLEEELTESGPNERSVNALIDNLKLRLNLLYRLKDKLKELNNKTNKLEETQA